MTIKLSALCTCAARVIGFDAVRDRGRKRLKSRLPIIMAGTAIVALMMTGYLLRLQPAIEPKAASAPLSASLRLKGAFDPDFAGEMVAARAGLFDREGLHIDLKAGNAEADPVRLVSSGVDSFGVAGATSFLVARAEGAPIVAFAAAYLESPVVFYVHEKSGIHTPKDFFGKRVGYQPTQDTAILYQAIMAKLLLSRSEVHEVHVSSDVAPFLNGTVDVWPGHVGVEAYAFRQAGVGYNVFGPADFGVHVPGTVYFTTERTIREQPTLVRRFLRAVISGWELTYADEATSVPLIASYDPTMLTPELIRFRLQQQREFLRPLGARFGEFEVTHWQSLQDILVQQRLIKEPIDLSNVVTFDFLRDAYRRSGAP
jgi:ABC-type nitrate/sulfonate/bicarbonate transport system substrate-binding protein